MSQQRARTVDVIDTDGLRGTVDADALRQSGGGQVTVHTANGRQVLVPADELLPQSDGSFALPFSLAEITAASDAARERGGARRGAGGQRGETVVMPVIAETLEMHKRRVDSGGVRIRKIVHEREEIVDEPLIREEVHVRRVPVGRVVDGPVPVRHVGNTMIVSILEEVLVVEKRVMLKEELHITKGEVETHKPQRVVLRTEEAQVERVGASGRSEGTSGGHAGDDDEGGTTAPLSGQRGRGGVS